MSQRDPLFIVDEPIRLGTTHLVLPQPNIFIIIFENALDVWSRTTNQATVKNSNTAHKIQREWYSFKSRRRSAETKHNRHVNFCC